MFPNQNSFLEMMKTPLLPRIYLNSLDILYIIESQNLKKAKKMKI
jgi:hypothetical protein